MDGTGGVLTLGADTIVQMFGWNWDSIGQECTQYLGPAGARAALSIAE